MGCELRNPGHLDLQVRLNYVRLHVTVNTQHRGIMKTPNLRIALALTSDAKDVAQYLPGNYSVIGRTMELENNKTSLTLMGILIAGVDDHGWTLDDYVIPRLGSGMIPCREIEDFNIGSLYEVTQ